MPKRKIIENALIKAQEIEDAAMDNAKEKMLEAFSPEFTKYFQRVLKEEDEYEVDDEATPDKEEPVEESCGDGDIEEGTEHDSGKDPDNGRGTTDPSEEAQDELTEADDDNLSDKQKKIDIDDDGDIDGEDFENLRSGKKDADVNEDVDIEVNDDDESEDDGEEVAPKEKDEPAEDKEETPPAEDKDEDPAPKSDEEDSEMDVPEELFDDEEDSEEDDGIKLSDDLDEDDEELDFDLQDDSEESELAAGDEQNFEIEDDEIEEGLYIRKEGEFTKITPEEYLNVRKAELEEENEKLSKAIGALEGQLEESNLFNAKLANVNKLFESGIFTKSEKVSFVQKVDECDSIEEANALYESTMKNAKADYNPLDSFNEILAETRNKKQPENIFESAEMIRMRRMAGMEPK